MEINIRRWYDEAFLWVIDFFSTDCGQKICIIYIFFKYCIIPPSTPLPQTSTHEQNTYIYIYTSSCANNWIHLRTDEKKKINKSEIFIYIFWVLIKWILTEWHNQGKQVFQLDSNNYNFSRITCFTVTETMLNNSSEENREMYNNIGTLYLNLNL